MPLVKVPLFSNNQRVQDQPQKRSVSGMQKFYRNISNSGGNDNAAAKRNLQNVTPKKQAPKATISDESLVTVKLNPSTVQKFLTQINVVQTSSRDTKKNVSKCKIGKTYDGHVYENVDIGSLPIDRTTSQKIKTEKTDSVRLVSAVKNVTVIKVEDKNLENKTQSFAQSSCDAKLSKALETFDKILSEFTSQPKPPVTPFVPPKLQKAKTCSIIESRCILKKSNHPHNKQKEGSDKNNGNHPPLGKTKSLWNLNDMEEMHLNSKIPIFIPSLSENTNKYNTYKVSGKENAIDATPIKTAELAKLDVKTRILRKTFSNPPSTPVPVIGKPNKKVERRISDPNKKIKPVRPSGSSPSKNQGLTKSKTSDHIEVPKTRMQKSRSIWEMSKTSNSNQNRPLARTKSSASLTGSSSKIPIVRGPNAAPSRVSSTRALFSPTPDDLNGLDQSKDSGAANKKQIKILENADGKKSPLKRIEIKTYKTSEKNRSATDFKTNNSSDLNEINRVRAKIQQKKLANKDASVLETRIKRTDPIVDPTLSAVKSIINKLEMHCATEEQADPIPFQNCKIISPLPNTIGVANMSLQSGFAVLPKRPIKTIETKNDTEVCKINAEDAALTNRKLSLASSKSFASSDEKIYEGHSDYSDDSGHVSNESESVLESNKIIKNLKDKKITNISSTIGLKTALANRKVPKIEDETFKNEIKPDILSDLKSENLASAAVPIPAERRLQSYKSEVLLRAGALSGLERARDERLRARITRLQAYCRGTLARRALARRRVQEVAVRCLQRNVRAFLAVRDWPWWRLLVRITPLLAVHRTEDQLRAKTEELEALRLKVEKLDQERSSLKHENDKLENKLSEMTAELAVEQAAGSLASERLGAETAERLRLEKDLQAAKATNAGLQQTSERLETELMYARAETNGSVASETGDGGAGSDSEGSGDGGRYKRRLQVALRELDAARRQLRQQHEDDLEQLVTLKKQLEKKAADAYEEAEEQRQVAAQWKRKAQKAASDANDVRLLLDEQGARATLLERRQRKFDAECQQLREEARRERQTRERAQRDCETLLAEKCALEQSLADARMELESREEKLNGVQRELDDLAFGGKTEEEVGALRKTKHDLENKCHDQEEELDELAGQIQLLESHKVRLEMSLEQQRKAARLEASQRDEELEEVRAQSAKKIKTLESQLEMEHGERTLVLRERHELERRLAALEESARADAAERDQREQRAKRDLRRYKALARDAQVVLERREQDSGAKAQLRQLRDKLDDAEVALRAAQKARQMAESELAEAQSAAEEAGRGRREAEMRATQAQREAASARAQLEEAEEEAADVMKKYRACVAALSEEQRAAKEAAARASAAEEEARAARDRAAELAARLASLDSAASAGQAAQHDKLELRTKELEASLELEQTARARLEAQVARSRDAASAGAQALGAAQQREHATADDLRKAMRTVRELREELSAAGSRCDEAVRARSEAEARLEEERANAASARADLRNTNQRLLLLQQAIADDISPDNGSDSENDSCSFEESIETFLANHKISPTPISHHGAATPRSSEGRQSRSSVTSAKQMSPAKDSSA